MTACGPAILIPAAGLSSRMRGRDKLLEKLGGVTLLARQVGRALSTGAPVLVTLGPEAADRQAVLRNLGHDNLSLVPVADATEGMAASIRAGVAALGAGARPVMILLPDMPDITTSDLTLMMLAHSADPDRILQATGTDGTPGHPVIFPHRLFPRLLDLRGDRGAKAIVADETPQYLALSGRRALTDLDTPEDWQAWRDAQS